MAAKSRIVKWQNTREIKTKKKYNGESSPYWQFVFNSNRKNVSRDSDQENSEYPTANPDVLPEAEELKENLTHKILLRDWKEIKFSKQEQGVLYLLAKGIKQEEIARRLKTTRVAVAQALIRIQKKGAKWYANKVANQTTYSTEEEQE